MNEENKLKLFKDFAGGPQAREVLYGFFETDKMRVQFKGAEGIALYEEIIGIADKAGAPLDEVRNRLILPC